MDIVGHAGNVQKKLETVTEINSVLTAKDKFGTHSIRDK